MYKYEVYITGECRGTIEVIEAPSDTVAKRKARKHHNPHQSNFTWYGSTIVTNLTTREEWMLEAGNERKGWQVYKG